MSSFFNRIVKYVTLGSTKRLVGRDLDGNKFYELPAANGGNMKRVVEYKVTRDIADYTSGAQRLPVQWTTWLSHTRSDPPTEAELLADRSRQTRLGPMIAAIEEREREERIRQGYLPAPGSGEDGQSVGQIAGPSTARHSGLRFGQGAEQRSGNAQARVNTAPSFVRGLQAGERGKSPKQQGVVQTVGEARGALGAERQGSSAEASSSSQAQGQSSSAPYPVPTPETPGVAPPSRTVDPSAHSSPEELRKLSEEDTKRRIRESERKTPPAQAEPAGSASDGVQGVTGGSDFKPRRRGA